MRSVYLSDKIENLEDLTTSPSLNLKNEHSQRQAETKQIWQPKENTLPPVQIMLYEQNNTFNLMP